MVVHTTRRLQNRFYFVNKCTHADTQTDTLKTISAFTVATAGNNIIVFMHI